MNEDRIKEMIQQAIDQNATANQFAVSDTPFHTHNGADSQRFSFKNLSDVPNSYYQQAGRPLIVNSTETALVFGVAGLVGTKIYYVADTSSGATTRKLTFQNGILISET